MERAVTMVNPTISDDEEYNETMQNCLSEMFRAVGNKMMQEAVKEGWKAPNQVAAEKAIVLVEIAERLEGLHSWREDEKDTIKAVEDLLKKEASEHLQDAIESMFPGTSKPA